MKALTRRVGIAVATGALGVVVLGGCLPTQQSSGADGPPMPSSADAGDGISADGPKEPVDEAKAPPIINGVSQDGVYDCAGQDIIINASSSTIHLKGQCGAVTVNGAQLQVTVDDATTITVNGADVKVVYGGDPTVSVNGVNSEAIPG